MGYVVAFVAGFAVCIWAVALLMDFGGPTDDQKRADWLEREVARLRNEQGRTRR